MIQVFSQHTEAKSPMAPNEDRLVCTPDFVAVIDGATAKSSPPSGIPVDSTPGAIAAERIAEAIAKLDADVDCVQAIEACTDRLARWKESPSPPTASLAMYSRVRKEVWVVGSAIALIGDRHYEFEPSHETFSSGTRAAYLTALLAEGKDPSLLRVEDPGRQMVLPLLRLEKNLRNVDGDLPWYYGGIDGRPVPRRLVNVLEVEAGVPVTLATDGYPRLLPTLAETEAYLASVLERDPLMIGRHPKVKGMSPDSLSYDDRTYVQFRDD
jgi:hypothetical protein